MMSEAKCTEVLRLYEDALESADMRGGINKQLAHVLEMIPRMRLMIRVGHREKFMRWLGFMQGVLYANGLYTIEEMKQHNRPDNE